MLRAVAEEWHLMLSQKLRLHAFQPYTIAPDSRTFGEPTGTAGKGRRCQSRPWLISGALRGRWRGEGPEPVLGRGMGEKARLAHGLEHERLVGPWGKPCRPGVDVDESGPSLRPGSAQALVRSRVSAF